MIEIIIKEENKIIYKQEHKSIFDFLNCMYGDGEHDLQLLSYLHGDNFQK